MRIQPIVEGHGELNAVGILIRRLLEEAHVWDVDVANPIRRSRGQLTQRTGFGLALKLARIQNGSGPILILFDGDDDCPAELAARLLQWASEEAADIPCEVVVAHREYEAWFLGAIESLRGERGVRTDAISHPSPEAPRDAKGALEERMQANASYAETIDQAALTARFSFEAAYGRCRSFRKLAKAFGALLRSIGRAPMAWPPRGWTG